MKKKKVKKVVKIGKFEKLFYSLALIILIAIPFTVVFLQATLSKINVQVEQVKNEIKTQQKKNESLSMKINELASLDKIIEVAHKQGLSYNNNNIKSVE
jgi:cell division protein FtsL